MQHKPLIYNADEEPALPVDARLEFPDGRVIPLDLIYQGLDDENQHVWATVQVIDIHEDDRPDLVVGSLPGQTTILVRCQQA